MINCQLLIIVALAITNLVCYGSSSQSCIFIGCACQRERVRCPIEPTPISMFPKRRIADSGGGQTQDQEQHQQAANLSIDLSSNHLEMVPDDRFADLDVHVLDLSNNRIVRLSPDAFRDLARLVHLSLASNRLRSLSASLFNPVKDSLEALLLSANQLGEMETTRLANVFARLTSLRRLDLSANHLVELPDLTALVRLTHLDLRQNELEALVDSDTLENLLPPSLVELYLDDNQLKHISENWFENLASLRYLSLSNNQISAIYENSFEKLTSLATINLSRNMLKHIPSEIIYTLDSLEVLDLSSQSPPIQHIDDYAFDRASNKKPIKRVLLHNNSISTLAKRAFCVRSSSGGRTSSTVNRLYYANIKEIDLSRNQLVSLDACVLRQLARGYSEPIYTSKLKLYTKVVLNRDRTETLIECSCEITRANKLLDLDGFCRRTDATTAYLNQYDCGDYTISNANQVNRFCASRIETECIATTNENINQNAEYLSWTTYTSNPLTSTQHSTSPTAPFETSPTLPFNNNHSHNYSSSNKTTDILPTSEHELKSQSSSSSVSSYYSSSSSYYDNNNNNDNESDNKNNNDQVDPSLKDSEQQRNQSARGVALSSSSVISVTAVVSSDSSSSFSASSALYSSINTSSRLSLYTFLVFFLVSFFY